jgi:hypothetical protein
MNGIPRPFVLVVKASGAEAVGSSKNRLLKLKAEEAPDTAMNGEADLEAESTSVVKAEIDREEDDGRCKYEKCSPLTR